MKSLRHPTIFLIALFAILMSPRSFAQEPGILETISLGIDKGLGPIADFVGGIVFFSIPIAGQSLPIVLIILGGTAIFLTIYFGFINFRGFGIAIKTATGKYTPKDAPGEITHFQALSAALSATVGLGNIAGVAVAIGLGGPGATFWMILMGLFGMTTKFAECTLGVKYRRIDPNGKVRGGGMYYLRDGLKERGLGGLGAVLAAIFAVFVIGGAFGAGNMFQANQAFSQFESSWAPGLSPVIFGLVIAVLVGSVIIGGIVWIARVTSLLVPIMCIGYMITAFIIIAMNLDKVGGAFATIFAGAFSSQAIAGGFVGILIQGIKRAAFSNEAGLGSAPIAHSAVKTDKPASEGFVALLEPFTDTVVVCTMTALVIVIVGTWQVSGEISADSAPMVSDPAYPEVVQTLEAGQFVHTKGSRTREVESGETEEWKEVIGLISADYEETEVSGWVRADQIESRSGIPVTSMAFASAIEWFPRLLSIAVLLFAFSTMISWSYYGEQGVRYLARLTGNEKAPDVCVLIYKVVFCLLVVVGASAQLNNVINLSDALIFAMVVPNMIGMYMLLPVVKEEANKFLEHVRSVEGK
tara:strand:+ start:500 stop:2248 length:1749 start_codon:yes stop_codon:yes gene_type:complete